MWRLAIVLLLAANLVGAFALGEDGAVRLGERVVASVFGAEHDCCCQSNCACDHGSPDSDSCPTDCDAAAASAPAVHLTVAVFELYEAPSPEQARAWARPVSISEFVPLPPTHVPIAG